MKDHEKPKSPAVVSLRNLLVPRGIEMPTPNRTTAHVGTQTTHTSTYTLTLDPKQFSGTGTGSRYCDSDNAAAEALMPQIERIVSGMPKVFRPRQTVRGSHRKLYAERRYKQALVALCRDSLESPMIVEEGHVPVTTRRVSGPPRTVFIYTARSGRFSATEKRLKRLDAEAAACCSLYNQILREVPDPSAA